MILNDDQIKQNLQEREIGVTPLPDDEQIQPASLDLRLGRDVVLPQYGHKWTEEEKHVFDPGVRYLCRTAEVVDLPNDIAAQLAGRSSIGRLGLIVHKTAGWIDPGFTGSITLEVMNMGQQPVSVAVGERVAQLVFHVLIAPSDGYDGQYQQQREPQI